MRQVLARLYDPRLANSESVIEPPVMWVKYPPSIVTMSRVELFDAIELIGEWLLRGHKHFVSELTALREKLRAQAHLLTTPVEYRTFSRYARMPPHLLKDAYDGAVQKALADRRLASLVSFDALDEVVQARFPGAQWALAARARLERHLREEDRRSERFAKLSSAQRASYEKFEARSKQLDAPGAELWRELAWQSINLSDAGLDRAAVQERLVDGLGTVYEHLLHGIDAAIQAERRRRHPESWFGKVMDNYGKAWGDPYKPWFGPDGIRGPHELMFFKARLRLRRDDDPFACAYYWAEDYLKAKWRLTDPHAAQAELQAQALGAFLVHWATIAQFGPQARAQFAAAGNYATRTAVNLLRNTMVGVRLALGDLGGSGAEVGGVGNRPTITEVSPSPPAGARPPVLRGPDLPDPPTSTAPGRWQPQAGTRAAGPGAEVPTTTAGPPTRSPSPSTAGAPTPSPAPSTAGAPTPSPAPSTAEAPTSSPTQPTNAPAPSPSQWTPPPAPTTPPPPPRFVKARDLGYPSPSADPSVVERLRQAIVSALSIDIKSGADRDLPPGWRNMYMRIKRALDGNGDSASKQVLAVIDVVWGALRNPSLFGEVVVEAWQRAMSADTSIDAELIAMAEGNANTTAAWIPRHLRQWLGNNPGAFFDLYASQPTPFVDLALLGDQHRALSHLIQDLVVDLAFKRAKINMTSAQFRALLARLPGTITPARVAGGPVIQPERAQAIPLGDLIWQLTYDLNVTAMDQLPQPEAFGQALHALLEIQ